MKPELIVGGTHADARGTLRFCNDFDMSEVKRFYTISNSKEQPKRGWILHKRETKWFFPLKGKTIVRVRPMEGDECSNVQNVPPSLKLWRTSRMFELREDEPKVLKVPGGNWFLIEQDGAAEVQVFSNCRVGEFPNDDFRKEIDSPL